LLSKKCNNPEENADETSFLRFEILVKISISILAEAILIKNIPFFVTLSNSIHSKQGYYDGYKNRI